MNIAVMAPHIHGNGRTTVAALIAGELSTRNRHVCLTHARSQSESMYSYFTFNEVDSSTNPQQIVNLMKGGGIQKDHIPDYSRNISDYLDLFSLNESLQQGNISEENQAEVINFIARNAPYDFMIYDVDENNMEQSSVKAILSEADCVVLVLTQAVTELNRFKEIKAQFVSKTKKLPVIVVINKYAALYGKVKDVGDVIGVANTKSWRKLHFNAYIQYCENKGQLRFLLEQIQKRNPDVIELDSDIKHITQNILQIKREKRKERSIELRRG